MHVDYILSFPMVQREACVEENVQICGKRGFVSSEHRESSSGAQLFQPPSEIKQHLHSDPELVYYTQVKDGAIPPGYVADFLPLASAVREVNTFSTLRNITARVLLHERSKTVALAAASNFQTSRQLRQASEHQPRKYKSRLQKSVYSGPNARQDTDTAAAGPQNAVTFMFVLLY